MLGDNYIDRLLAQEIWVGLHMLALGYLALHFGCC